MPSVLAIAAHHDDIEFQMAGTLIQLRKRGWDLHYMNLCDGSRGSMVLDQKQSAATRLAEARNAAALLGATFYDPICPDMELTYSTELLQKVAAVVRRTKPTILLTQSPSCYMEDHEYACRLAVSAAFSHAMPNLETDPPEPIYTEPVTVYHCQPVGNREPLGNVVTPHFYVDVTDVIDKKEASLACHESQKQWLDESQGMDSYLKTMREGSAEVGQMSGRFEFAEGWRRREHWGFCGPDDNPLRDTLSDVVAAGSVEA